MITIKDLENLQNNDGMTLKKWGMVTYKTGWQVADYGMECNTADEAMEAIKKYDGNCGIWYSDNVYYIDHSMRIKNKKDAMKIGIENNQISILRWSDMKLVYCK